MIFFNGQRGSICQNPTLFFMIKILNKLGIEENCLNLIKSIYEKNMTYIILNKD